MSGLIALGIFCHAKGTRVIDLGMDVVSILC